MKNLISKKRSEGFTIIEVMIVLAIAGLIMVIVFIAVPQLQRNQRDNARQNITNRIKAEMETYAGNNQGQYPFTAAGNGTGTWTDFVSRYINGKVNVKDPSKGADVITNALGAPVGCANATCSGVTLPAAAGDFVTVFAAKCSGEALAQSGSNNVNTRTFAVMIGLDRAGTRYCVDNG